MKYISTAQFRNHCSTTKVRAMLTESDEFYISKRRRCLARACLECDQEQVEKIRITNLKHSLVWALECCLKGASFQVFRDNESIFFLVPTDRTIGEYDERISIERRLA